MYNFVDFLMLKMYLKKCVMLLGWYIYIFLNVIWKIIFENLQKQKEIL